VTAAPRDLPDYDVIVVGGGVAGLSVALGLAGRRHVALVVSEEDLGDGSTRWAQGGLAAAIGPDDTPALHAADTMTAGAGSGDRDAIRVLTESAPAALADLVARGAGFDREPDGRLALTREGGHHRDRVAHAGGDATGAEVSRCLAEAVRRSDVQVIERTSVVDVCVAHSVAGPLVTGVAVRRTTTDGEETAVLSAGAVVLATGGVGGLYETTTNPGAVTGEGLGLALRAGASLVDVEFVQFHPTALRIPTASGQLPLVTEALRGEGAVLRDGDGRRIMIGHHPMADLAPRDVVARRIDEVLARSGEPSREVVLDATGFGHGVLRDRFPTVYAACRRHGLDPERDGIPVTPAQHYLCGGVRTDLHGATDVAGLYAVGEVAATGVHGANRLASNSLVEGLVFGRRLAERLVAEVVGPRPAATRHDVPVVSVGTESIPALRSIMSRGAGIRRSGAGLAAALDALASLVAPPGFAAPPSPAAANRWLAAMAIVTSAATRLESRGCHWRSDHPERSELWRRPVVVRLDADGVPAVGHADALERTA
jgi:L-aspartate oxidase